MIFQVKIFDSKGRLKKIIPRKELVDKLDKQDTFPNPVSYKMYPSSDQLDKRSFRRLNYSGGDTE